MITGLMLPLIILLFRILCLDSRVLSRNQVELELIFSLVSELGMKTIDSGVDVVSNNVCLPCGVGDMDITILLLQFYLLVYHITL